MPERRASWKRRRPSSTFAPLIGLSAGTAGVGNPAGDPRRTPPRRPDRTHHRRRPRRARPRRRRDLRRSMHGAPRVPYFATTRKAVCAPGRRGADGEAELGEGRGRTPGRSRPTCSRGRRRRRRGRSWCPAKSGAMSKATAWVAGLKAAKEIAGTFSLVQDGGGEVARGRQGAARRAEVEVVGEPGSSDAGTLHEPLDLDELVAGRPAPVHGGVGERRVGRLVVQVVRCGGDADVELEPDVGAHRDGAARRRCWSRWCRRCRRPCRSRSRAARRRSPARSSCRG